MKVKDIMTKNVKTISPNATMEEAAQEMRKNKIGCLVVVEGEKPIGIITERDLAYKIIAQGKSLETKVREVMSSDLKTIEKDANIKQAAKLMASHVIRRLPVVEKGKLIGIVTIDDIMRAEKIGEDRRSYQYT
ncbi:MAG: hypothetical protein DRN95_01845 [Candidatus Hydrothermarchaeota archaeon]|nr:MAG: hypothetical protein DRN95_01845 [Candidatus Hydrothermarchaeota archaeon]